MGLRPLERFLILRFGQVICFALRNDCHQTLQSLAAVSGLLIKAMRISQI